MSCFQELRSAVNLNLLNEYTFPAVQFFSTRWHRNIPRQLCQDSFFYFIRWPCCQMKNHCPLKSVSARVKCVLQSPAVKTARSEFDHYVARRCNEKVKGFVESQRNLIYLHNNIQLLWSFYCYSSYLHLHSMS